MKVNDKKINFWIELLEAINSFGSIHQASKELAITYKTAWKRLNQLKEQHPNLILVESYIGGNDRGGTVLTSEGKRILMDLKLGKSE